MRSTSVAVLSSLLALASAQSAADIPQCAISCFTQAIGQTSCSLLDTYCQCSKGQSQIQAALIPCLCKSTCSASDLQKVTTVADGICSSALSASGQSYTPTPVASDACGATGAAGGAGGSSASSAMAMTSSAAMASASSMAASASSMAAGMSSSMPASMSMSMSASQSVAAQTGNAAAAVTAVPAAIFGAAGLLMAL